MKTPALASALLFLLLPVVVAAATAARRPRICYTRVDMPHQSVLVPFSEPTTLRIPLYLSFACSRTGRAIGTKKPVVIIMPGALTRPKDYTRIGNRLARKGFVTALPDYTKRDLFSLSPAFAPLKALLEERRNMGFRCPSRPQFASTKLISSVQLFLESKKTRRDVRRAVDPQKIIILGHSLGGDVSNRFFNEKCKSVSASASPDPYTIATSPSFFPRVLCEQFSPIAVPRTGVIGIVTYEGVNNRTIVDVSDKRFHVAMYSKFYQATISNIFSGKDFGRQTATVLIKNANHYGPNNFVTAFGNQTPQCAGKRRPPEDAFTTTRKTQNKVIDSIVEVIFSTYNSFMDTNGLETLSDLLSAPKLLVDNVTIQ